MHCARVLGMTLPQVSCLLFIFLCRWERPFRAPGRNGFYPCKMSALGLLSLCLLLPSAAAQTRISIFIYLITFSSAASFPPSVIWKCHNQWGWESQVDLLAEAWIVKQPNISTCGVRAHTCGSDSCAWMVLLWGTHRRVRMDAFVLVA